MQTHDNVESFRRLLNFARPNQTRVIFASSASIYGAATEASAESTAAAPANIYAFSKAIMDNLARGSRAENPDWIIVGLRYFNVYGPREAHKGVPASMIYHFSQQMRAGQRPRIFKHGEQQRDFVYVKDIVDGTIRALDAKRERNLQSRLRPGAIVQRADLYFESRRCRQIFSRITSIIRTPITKISPRRI